MSVFTSAADDLSGLGGGLGADIDSIQMSDGTKLSTLDALPSAQETLTGQRESPSIPTANTAIPFDRARAVRSPFPGVTARQPVISTPVITREGEIPYGELPSGTGGEVFQLVARTICGAIVGYAMAPHQDDRALYAGLGAAATGIGDVWGLGIFAYYTYTKKTGY